MAASTSLLAQVHRLLSPSAVDLGSDAELLQRFVRDRDQAAFAVLVARHGPMVLRLCRRVLGDMHAAEDACQAAFLVLVRKAHRLRDPETLSSWLHGVAYRLALKARAADVRRRQIETERLHSAPSPSAPDPLAEVSARELLAILDAELQRLPEKYRLPLILCCLEGRTQPEAARLLGWTPGSVKGRLERGRAQLQQRLLRRGLTLPAALLALEATANTASARLPALLSAALLCAASSAETGGISEAVLALAEGSIGGLPSAKGKLIAMLVLMLGLVTGGVGALVYPQLAAQPQKEQQETEPAPVAREAKQPKQQPRLDRYGDPLPPGALARLGTIRWRLPQFGVDRLVVAPDGKTLVSIHRRGGVSVWDGATGKIIRQVPSAFDPRPEWLDKKWGPIRRAVALSADAGTAVFPAPDGALYIVDISTSNVHQFCRGHGSAIQETALSADGKVLASRSEDGTLRIWEVASGKEIRQLHVPTQRSQQWAQYQPTHLALTPDGKTAAWVGTEKERPIHVYDISTGVEKHRLLEHPGGERSIAFSSRGDLLLASCGEGPDQLWDVRTGRLVRSLPHKPVLYPCAAGFTADGSRLALSAPGSLQLHDVGTGKEIWRINETRMDPVPEVLAFSPDGKVLFAATVFRLDWVLRRYDPRTGKHLVAPEEQRGNIDAMVFAPDDRSLYARCGDNRLSNWNAATGAIVRRTDAPGPGSFDFSADGRFFACTDRYRVSLYRLDSMKEVWHQATLPEGRPSYAFAFSADGASLAVSEWGNEKQGLRPRIVFRSSANGEELSAINDLDQPALDLLFNPDGRSLLWLTDNFKWGHADTRAVHFRDRSSGRKLREPLPFVARQLAPIAFSPDGKTLAMPSPNENTLDLWEYAVWKKRLELPPVTQYPCPLAFSPDGLLFLVGDDDGAVRIYDAHTGRLLRRQEGHRAVVSHLVFSHDGRKLVTVSFDTTALVWDITDLLRTARGQEVELTEAELRSLWEDLAAEDAAKVYQAVGRLAQGGKAALAWMRKKFPPAPAVDSQRLPRLIADLDDDRFVVREKATAQLAGLGELAAPALRKALAGHPAPELRRRAESLLKQAEELPVDRLRILRSVEVVESIGGTTAKTLLKEWAGGAAGASLTREAKAALERCRK